MPRKSTVEFWQTLGQTFQPRIYTDYTDKLPSFLASVKIRANPWLRLHSRQLSDAQKIDVLNFDKHLINFPAADLHGLPRISFVLFSHP
jgi:hypothetical protein